MKHGIVSIDFDVLRKILQLPADVCVEDVWTQRDIVPPVVHVRLEGWGVETSMRGFMLTSHAPTVKAINVIDMLQESDR